MGITPSKRQVLYTAIFGPDVIDLSIDRTGRRYLYEQGSGLKKRLVPTPQTLNWETVQARATSSQLSKSQPSSFYLMGSTGSFTTMK